MIHLGEASRSDTPSDRQLSLELADVKSPTTRPGFYTMSRPAGFTLYMVASPVHLFEARALIGETLGQASVAAETVEDVRLVASELIANAVAACGRWVPVVIDLDAEPDGIALAVHDPDRHRLPTPAAVVDDELESGRGLLLVGLLAPGWSVALTPTGKQVCCRVPRTPRRA